jgi:hypothetical protein
MDFVLASEDEQNVAKTWLAWDAGEGTGTGA